MTITQHKYLNILLSLSLSLFIIISAVFILCSFKSLYYYDIKNLNLAEKTSMTAYEIKLNYDYSIDYILGKTDDEFILPTLPSSAEGKIHFYEVRKIFETLKNLWFFTLSLNILALIFKFINKDYIFFNYAANILFIFSISIIAMSLINFKIAFSLFHNIFFNNNYWMFNSYTDPIILLLPQKFFYHCALFIISLIIISALLLKFTYNKILNSNYNTKF